MSNIRPIGDRQSACKFIRCSWDEVAVREQHKLPFFISAVLLGAWYCSEPLPYIPHRCWRFREPCPGQHSFPTQWMPALTHRLRPSEEPQQLLTRTTPREQHAKRRLLMLGAEKGVMRQEGGLLSRFARVLCRGFLDKVLRFVSKKALGGGSWSWKGRLEGTWMTEKRPFRGALPSHVPHHIRSTSQH